MLKDLRWRLSAIAPAVFTLPMLLPFGVMAQSPNPPPASSQESLKPQELEALVAPIALYPDTLLAEVLMASTYPLEVVQADRWATANKNLKEDQLKAAVDKQSWDGSVKALVATPSVLTMMSSKLDWTQKLGDAFLAQQTEMMDAIQRLRTKAQANNRLTSTKEQKVTVRQEQNRQVIAIEPTDPNTVYVPYYDPAVVYGEWPYADYPPYYFPDYYAGYIGPGLIATGIAFGAGYALSRWVSRRNLPQAWRAVSKPMISGSRQAHTFPQALQALTSLFSLNGWSASELTSSIRFPRSRRNAGFAVWNPQHRVRLFNRLRVDRLAIIRCIFHNQR